MTAPVTPSPASLSVPHSSGEPAPDLAAGQHPGGTPAPPVGPAGMLTAVQVCDRPCGSWRRDNAGRAGYDNLPDYAAGTIPGEPDFGRPDPGDPHAPLGVLFGCHRRAADGRLCAGHLAVVGHAHPLVRLGISIGLIDPAVLVPGDDWPALYDSYAQMLTATGHRPPGERDYRFFTTKAGLTVPHHDDPLEPSPAQLGETLTAAAGQWTPLDDIGTAIYVYGDRSVDVTVQRAQVEDELHQLRRDTEVHERRYLAVQKVLDGALGTEATHGTGAGLVADVALLAQRYADLKARTISGGWPLVVAEVEAADLRAADARPHVIEGVVDGG